MTLPSPNGAFSTYLPTLQTFWDSTSLGCLKQCPRLYQYTLVQGFAPRSESVHLSFGIWYHGALERYDHHRVGGMSHQDALREAVHWVLIQTWNKELQRPWISDSTQKNRTTLVRSVVWYLDQFGRESDPLETVILASGKPAVELSFKFQSSYSTASGEAYHLCGHLDRLVTLNGEPWVADRKTTGHTLDQRYFSQFSPDNQMSLYAFAAQVVLEVPAKGIIVDAAQIAVGFTRFVRQAIPRAPSQLDEWYEGLGEWLALAERYAKSAYWPMNEKACFGCAFRPICSHPPSSRGEWLEAGYKRRVWDPTVARGDI